MEQLRIPVAAILEQLEQLLGDSALSTTQKEALKDIEMEANALKGLLY